MADTNTPSLSSARLAAIECQRKAALSCGYTSVDFPRLSAPLLNVDIPDLLASHYALSAQVEALAQERDAALAREAQLREALTMVVDAWVNPGDGLPFEAGEVPAIDRARAALSAILEAEGHE